jgi:hypothetical protein
VEVAIRTAAGKVAVNTPDPHQPGRSLALRWGSQFDVKTVYLSGTDNNDLLVDAKVAGYIAKYATKGAEASSTADRPIRSVSDHALLLLAPVIVSPRLSGGRGKPTATSLCCTGPGIG